MMIIKKAIVNVNAIVSLLLVQGSAAGKAAKSNILSFPQFLLIRQQSPVVPAEQPATPQHLEQCLRVLLVKMQCQLSFLAAGGRWQCSSEDASSGVCDLRK